MILLNFVQIDAKLQYLAKSFDGSLKQGLEMGHYRHWLRHVLEIDEVVRMGYSGAQLKEANKDMISPYGPCPTNPVSVYGVKVRYVLPEGQIDLIKGAVVGIGPEIDSSRTVRRRRALNASETLYLKPRIQSLSLLRMTTNLIFINAEFSHWH